MAWPGNSEYQTGLTADIVEQNDQAAGQEAGGDAGSAVAQAHCTEYGFLLRAALPGKRESTSVGYEPITAIRVPMPPGRLPGLCLEEYRALDPAR